MSKTKNFDENKTRPLMPSEAREGENRRVKGDRLEVLFPVFASTLKGDLIQGYLEAINLSWSGMCFETDVPFKVGDQLILEFSLPETEYTIETKAKIIHKLDYDENVALIGVIFFEIETNLRRILNGYILEHL